MRAGICRGSFTQVLTWTGQYPHGGTSPTRSYADGAPIRSGSYLGPNSPSVRWRENPEGIWASSPKLRRMSYLG